MLQLARLVRWWFGLQAFILAAVSVVFAGSVAWRLIKGPAAVAHRVRPQTPASLPTLPFGLPSTKWTLLAVAFCFMASVVASAVAWWALRKGWRSARFWALSASLLNLPDFGFGTAFGVAGLIVFWRKDIVKAMAAEGQGKSPERIPGDGTHKYLDHLGQILAFALWIAAGYAWANWAAQRGLARHEGIQRWIELMGAIYVAVFFHELGHFLAGLRGDMSLRGFAVGPLAGQIRGGRWRLALNPGGVFGGGAVSMVPLHLRDLRRRYIYLVAAGPIFSLVTGLVALVLTLNAPHSPWQSAWRFFALTCSVCLCDFVINLIPLLPEGAYSDGAQILQLVKGGPWADSHMAFSMVGSSLVTPLRPSQFDLPLLERVARFYQSGKRGARVRLFIAIHHVDSGRAALAIEAWRDAARMDPEPSPGGAAEYTFLEAVVAQDPEKARAWWKYVESKDDRRHEVDYWRGRAAVLWAEGDFYQARHALEKADSFAQRLPRAGAYEYDRWCLDELRERLRPGQSPTDDLPVEPAPPIAASAV
jgi:hypothetical protein